MIKNKFTFNTGKKIVKYGDHENMRLCVTILLNRILQTEKSSARKTHKQIAIKHKCTLQKVELAEQFINLKLSEKISILKVILNVKK